MGLPTIKIVPTNPILVPISDIKHGNIFRCDQYGKDIFLKTTRTGIVNISDKNSYLYTNGDGYFDTNLCGDLGSFQDYIKRGGEGGNSVSLVSARDVPYGTVARLEKCNWIGVVIWESQHYSTINRRLLPVENGFVNSGIYLDALHNLEILGKMEVSLEK